VAAWAAEPGQDVREEKESSDAYAKREPSKRIIRGCRIKPKNEKGGMKL
jgi:hypothetical protein